MRRRILNIASAICLGACVALMGMWVQSYQSNNDVRNDSITYRVVKTSLGRLMVSDVPFMVAGIAPNGSVVIYTGVYPQRSLHLGQSNRSLGFGLGHTPAEFSILMLPFWFLVLAGGSLAMTFQLRWPLRFTLRSLFVVTSFLAIVLGMIA